VIKRRDLDGLSIFRELAMLVRPRNSIEGWEGMLERIAEFGVCCEIDGKFITVRMALGSRYHIERIPLDIYDNKSIFIVAFPGASRRLFDIMYRIAPADEWFNIEPEMSKLINAERKRQNGINSR